jgi:hypothetical protein
MGDAPGGMISPEAIDIFIRRLDAIQTYPLKDYPYIWAQSVYAFYPC